MKIELLKIKEDNRRCVYKINQDVIHINGNVFKVQKSLSNFSGYLKSNGTTIVEFLNESIDNKCIHCSSNIDYNFFARNKFITYKYCKKCDVDKIRKLYKIKSCIICNKQLYYKDIIFSTCGNDECLKKHRYNINENIKNNHWIKSDNKEEIQTKKLSKRLENDIKLNRKYNAWNKGKTGIYSKETIEKIRNATIKQMKEKRIHKTKQEQIFESFLIQNDIKYVYSYIYKKRQFDFLLTDFDLIVELQGDYWHANPKFWDVENNDTSKKQLYETQKMKIKDDIIKKELINNSKFNFIEFWEYDIHNNFELIIETLKNKFNLKIKQ